MYRETQNYTNEELNVLKKRYNDSEGWWNRALLVLLPLNGVLLKIKFSDIDSLLFSDRIERENFILDQDVNPGL